MSHWAELDSDNKVIRVTVGDNNEPDEGHEWLINNLGGTWIKTSYNNKIRKRFAGTGMTYREDLDAFVTPQCHEEAILNETTIEWECSNDEHIITIS
jgi:hypothetical protein